VTENLEKFCKILRTKQALNIALSIRHSGWVKGDHTNFEIDPFFGVEGTDLYTDVKYTTVDEYLNKFL